MPFQDTKDLLCLDCGEPFVAAVITERRNRELARETTRCPRCGGVRAVPIEVPQRVRA